LLHLDELEDGVLELLRTTSFRLLEILPSGVPIACVVGVVWSLTSAVKAREITAIRCGGIALRSALAPILVTSLLIAVGLGWFEDRVIIKARQAQIASERNEQGEAGRPSLVRTNGRYWYAGGTFIFAASSYEPETGTLRGVTVFELSDTRGLKRRIDAEAADYVDGHSWELRDAIVREFSGARFEQSRAQTLSLDLGISGGDFEHAERPLSAETLNGMAKRLRRGRPTDDERYAIQASFHGRLAQPLAVLILVLFAIPFAVGDVERGDSLPRALLGALGVTAGYWVLWGMGLLVARSGWLPPPLPVWGVVVLLLGVAGWRFRALRE
jgi:lipopolysaccharide export system permease protein